MQPMDAIPFPGQSHQTENWQSAQTKTQKMSTQRKRNREGNSSSIVFLSRTYAPTQLTHTDWERVSKSHPRLHTVALILAQSFPFPPGCHSYSLPPCLYFGKGETLALCVCVHERACVCGNPPPPLDWVLTLPICQLYIFTPTGHLRQEGVR